MKRTFAALALLAAGYTAGTLAPHASAADSLQGVVHQLEGIHAELSAMRRVMEKRP